MIRSDARAIKLLETDILIGEGQMRCGLVGLAIVLALPHYHAHGRFLSLPKSFENGEDLRLVPESDGITVVVNMLVAP